MHERFTRRSLLRVLGSTGLVAIAGVGLAACGGNAVTAATSAAAAATSAAAVATSAAAAVTSAAAAATTSAAATSSAAATTTSAAAAATTTSAAAVTTSSAAAATSAPNKSGLVLQFWIPTGDTLGHKIMDELTVAFNKPETDFQIQDPYIASTNHYTKYVTAIAAGQAPDAMMTYDYSPIVTWSSQGLIIPLDAYAAQSGVKESDYFPIAWQMINFNGHLWGFMQEFDFQILAWNKDLFQAAGLDPNTPPKTTDEMDAMSTKLLKTKADGSLGQIPFAPWITADTPTWTACFGGSYFDATKGEFTIVTDANVKAMEWYLKYADMLGGPDKVTSFTKLFTGNQTPFYNGQMAMEGIGEYVPITLPDLAPKLKYGVAFPPTATGVPYGSGATGGGNVFVIPKGVKHQAESVTLIKWMGSDQAVLQWNVEENNVPPTTAVAYSAEFAAKVPLMTTWIDMLKTNHMTPPIISPVIDYFSDQLTFATQQVIYKKASPKDALTQLDQKTKQQLAQTK